MGVTRLAINRPIAILMLMLALIILGLSSYFKMPVELSPKVDFGFVTVTTTYPGTNPQEIETLITKPIEDSISGVSGLRQITSTSQQGTSVVSCQFVVGADMETAAAEIRDKVDTARKRLPREADSPVVSRADTSAQPVMYLVMEGKRSSRELRVLADNIVMQRLEQAPDIAAVNVVGGDQREVRVAIHRDRLSAYGVTISQIASAIQQANTNISVGEIQRDDQYASVRFLGQFANVDELKNLRLPLPQAASGTGAAASSGRVIRLTDIATVTDTTVERTSSSTLDGKDAVTIAVSKTSDGNTMAACDGIKKQLKDLEKVLPPDVKFTFTFDASGRVTDNVKDVVVSLCLGAFFAVFVVFLFLHNIRATAIVALAIPICVISTFLPLSVFGFTLNSMTLLGLSLAIGILIDDSIVVIENIVRHLRMGETPVQAAINGRMEIGLAALTLTAVDLVVFVPMSFMGGMIGQWFHAFGAAISISVATSLFVSFTVTPMLASRWFKPGEELESDGHGKRGFFAAFNRGYGHFQEGYRRLLAAAIRHPWTVVLVGNLVLILTMAGIGAAGTGMKALPGAITMGVKIFIFGLLIALWHPIMAVLGWALNPLVRLWGAIVRSPYLRGLRHTPNVRILMEPIVVGAVGALLAVGLIMGFALFGQPFGFRFAPDQDQNQVNVVIEAPAGSSLAYTQRIAMEVERRIRADASLKGDVKYLLTSLGQSQGGGFGTGDHGTQYGNIQVSLYEKSAPLDKFHRAKPGDEPLREETDIAVAAKISKLIAPIPGAKLQATAVTGWGGGGAPVNIPLYGTDFNEIIPAANKIKNLLAKTPGVFNADISFKSSQPEVQIRLDRTRAADYGLSLEQVSQAVSMAMQGDTTAKFRDPGDNEQYDIRVELSDVDRHDIYSVGNIPVGNQGANPVLLRDVANISMGAGPVRVDRLNRLRQVSVTAYLRPGTQIGNLRQKVDPEMQRMSKAGEFGNVTYSWSGEAQSLSEEGPYFMATVLLGIVLAYMLMAALFNNLGYPLSVMLTLPQALVGALTALMITNTPFSLIAAIGVIMLNALAAKNGILMVDFTNTLRARGYKRDAAIMEAAPTRLRPVLMTSAAIICATLPTAIGLGRGAGFRQSLGITVVGGVFVSTLLTLVVVPCAYILFDALTNFSRRTRGQEGTDADFSPEAYAWAVETGGGSNGSAASGNGHASGGGRQPVALRATPDDADEELGVR